VIDAALAKVRIDTSQKQEAADPHDHGMPPAPTAPAPEAPPAGQP